MRSEQNQWHRKLTEAMLPFVAVFITENIFKLSIHKLYGPLFLCPPPRCQYFNLR